MILNDFIKGNLQKVKWGKYRIGDLFEMEKTLSFNKEKLVIGTQYEIILQEHHKIKGYYKRLVL